MRARAAWLLVLAAACGGSGDDDDGDGPGPIIEPGDPGPADVRVDVRTDTARAPISPLIYGINFGADVERDRPQVQRSGGNRLTAYNWENNASNAGSDYCHQNDATFGGPGTPPGNAYRGLLDDARARGTAAIITVPIVDHVAADHDDLGDGGQGPPACVGDVRNSGSNYLDTRFHDNVAQKGAPFAATPDLGDGRVFQDEAIDFVRRTWGDVEVLISLDNEPDLWSSTHARIHPDPVTYAELAERNLRFAAAAKAAWPEAEVLGFVSYGFAGFSTLQNAPDWNNRPFLPFYLGAMRQAETDTGVRHIDYLDLHWYPEARGDGVRISDVDSGLGAAARLQAPRSLWDPDYEEDSWIVNDVLQAPIHLIPSLREQIATSYPGTKLAFTEWNYGGGDHISGALATADVLGVFGREQVGLATIWLLRPPARERFTLAGLRAYTNFDGAGGAFGDTSVSATTDDVARVTVYASDAGDSSRQVIVLINKHGAPLTAGVRIAAPRALATAKRWVLEGTSSDLESRESVAASATNAFAIPLPAYSVTVLLPE